VGGDTAVRVSLFAFVAGITPDLDASLPPPSLFHQAVIANLLGCVWFRLIPSIHLNVLAIVYPVVLGKFNHQVATARQSFAAAHSLVALQFKGFRVLLNVNNDNPRYNLRAFHLNRRSVLHERLLGRRMTKVAVNTANRETVLFITAPTMQRLFQ